MLISYTRHQFPPVVIQHAIWFYVRFTLSYRDVDELLAERGALPPNAAPVQGRGSGPMEGIVYSQDALPGLCHGKRTGAQSALGAGILGCCGQLGAKAMQRVAKVLGRPIGDLRRSRPHQAQR